jgi:4Fe-4S iron-sulfur cluster binding domain/DR2241 stabilising domain
MIRDDLARLIKAGYNALGELEFTESSHGYFLYHWADRNSLPEAEIYHSAADARQIAKFDFSGAYRPLKGAPNLPRGWLIELTSIDALKRALDYFYPGAVSSWLAYQAGAATPVCLRRTLNRQTGMYRVTGQLSEDQARNLVQEACRSDSRCLRTILWGIEENQSPDFLPSSKSDPTVDQTGQQRAALPFLCLEACNLLVAAARTTLKKSPR